MTDDEILEIVQAHKNGKTIEYKRNGSAKWYVTNTPAWNFPNAKYRIKPELREYLLVIPNEGRACAFPFYDRKRGATHALEGYEDCKVIKVVEVLDEETPE